MFLSPCHNLSLRRQRRPSVEILETRILLNGDYGAYLSSIDVANQTSNVSVSDAASRRDLAFFSAQSDAQAAALVAYNAYKAAIQAGFDAAAAEMNAAKDAYRSTMAQADSSLRVALGQVDAAYIAAMDTALSNLSTAMNSADRSYTPSERDVNADYDTAIASYEQAYDAAYVSHQAEPENPDLLAAWQQAQQNFASANTTASAALEGDMVASNAAWELAVSGACQACLNAFHDALAAYSQSISGALQQYQLAATEAWQAYQTRAYAAMFGFYQVEFSAAAEYQNMLGQIMMDLSLRAASASSQHMADISNAHNTWRASEQAAWAAYIAGFEGNPNLAPGARAGGPPMVPGGFGQWPTLNTNWPLGWTGPALSTLLVAPASPDSVSQSVTSAVASGDPARIRAVLQVAGDFISAELRQTALAAAIRLEAHAAALTAQAIAVQQATTQTYAAIMRAFLEQGFRPAFNQVTQAAMRYYQQVARNAIANYERQLLRNPPNAQNLRDNILNQQDRLRRIAEWLTQNGLTP